MSLRSLHFAVLLIAFLTGAATAQDRTITVTGTAEMSRVPDTAHLRVGVETEAPTSEMATDTLTTRIASLFGVLSAAGIAEADIQTTNLVLMPVQPDGDWREGTPRPIRAAATLTVQVRDLDLLGPLLDDLVRGGANRLDGVEFALADPGAARAEAQEAALADARSSAETYAAAAGVRVGEVVAISDQTGPIRPMMADASAAGRAMPVAAGRVDVAARVTVVYAIRN